jgi:hypothetical protein
MILRLSITSSSLDSVVVKRFIRLDAKRNVSSRMVQLPTVAQQGGAHSNGTRDYLRWCGAWLLQVFVRGSMQGVLVNAAFHA